MRKLFVIAAGILVFMFLMTPISFGADTPHIFFNWQGTKTADMKIEIKGLETNPIQCDFTKLANPDDPADQAYYRVEYEGALDLPDGTYSITGKMIRPVVQIIDGVTHITTVQSEESAPFPFVRERIVEDTVENVGFGVW